jgi:ketosteroid isomerase-like protein
VWIAFAAILGAAGAEDEIGKAEKAWSAAVTGGDYAALDRMLTNQLIYAHASGVVETKGEYVGRLRSGAQKYDRVEHQKMTVRVYADAAVVHANMRMVGKSNGQAFDDQVMMLHLWVKQGGAWRLAAHQTTRLP